MGDRSVRPQRQRWAIKWANHPISSQLIRQAYIVGLEIRVVMGKKATAFVPGHITGFFSAHPAEDPTRAGSRGAGLTLTDGVTVTAERADETTIRYRGKPTAIDPVGAVLEDLGATARIEATSTLPLGAGFGVSGALSLGTALAVNQCFNRSHSVNELVTIAHVAEVQAGTGLGDVVAQDRGGIPLRLDPGAPAVNRLDGIPARTRVEYLTFGSLSTNAVLDGATEQLSRAGERALEAVVAEPTLETFIEASRRFAADAELLTPAVEAVLSDIDDQGGHASMAMLGNTVFGLGRTLSNAGYDPVVCEVHPAGATMR